MSELGQLFDHLEKGQVPQLTPDPPIRTGWDALRYSFWDAPIQAVNAHRLHKAIESDFLEAQKKASAAAVQGTVVTPALQVIGAYAGASGVLEPTRISMQSLLNLAEMCPPVLAVIGKRIEQVAAFSRPRHSHMGRSHEPGFHIRMTNRDEKPSAEDKKQMAILEQFVEEAGFCPPPDEERPIGWQPGFDQFLRAIVRDSLTLDWVAVRTWKSATDPKKYPVVAFAPEDASKIRRLRREYINLINNVAVTKPREGERTTTHKEIVTVKVVDSGGSKVEEYTKDELFVGSRRPRTDGTVFGYGYSELEEVVNVALGWSNALKHNTSRFYLNSLPRGIFEIIGQMGGQQQSAFQLNMQEMMQGVGKNWRIPVFSLPSNAGPRDGINFKPFDLSPHEMEFSQFLFILGLLIHCAYHIHPDETGYSAASPFRPPLSEASPESNLKNSMDTGLRPLVLWVEDFINRNIIWRMFPSRRYKLEFVGLGDWDEMLDVQMRQARMTAGLSTPEMECNELDIDMPDEVKSHPAFKFPAPFVQGYQMLESMKQQGQQQNQAQEAHQAQMEHIGAQTDMIKQGKMPAMTSGQPGQAGSESPGNIKAAQQVPGGNSYGGPTAPKPGNQRF